MNRMKSTGLMGIFLSSLLLCGYSEMTGKVREGGERAFGPAGGVEALRDYVAFVSDVERRKGASSPILGTAGEWYQMAMDSALSWSSDVLPVVIFNTDTLDTEGTSRGWGYSFFSSLMDSVLYVQVSDAVVQFSQSQPPLFTDPISGSWIDSDDIIPVTEVSGGSVYRDSNTGVLLQAFLAGQLYDPCVSNSYFWTIGYTSESSSELDFFMKGTNPVLYGYEFLCEGTEVTAASAVQAARQKSLLWAGDAGLFRIESVGTLDELGRSSGWLFEYLSMSKGRKRLYRTCDDSTYTDRTTGVIGGWIPEVTDAGWLDSEAAMETAEENGGSDFRSEHPLTTARASLQESPTLPFGEHLWTIRYSDLYNEQLLVLVGAQSGVFRGAFDYKKNLDSLITSDISLSDAHTAASNWSPDASLYGIVSVTPLSYSVKGASSAWAYLFWSSQLSQSAAVTVQATTAGARVDLEPFSNPWQAGTLAEGWLASDSILVITGRAGGDGIGGGIELPHIEAVMARGLYQEDPQRPVWLVSYHSSCQGALFYLDAYSGEIIDGGVGIEEGEVTSPVLPKTAELLQNFPNPFNPQTTIRYCVDGKVTAHVRLRIFDLHGKLVETLVDGEREPGLHSVQWDGRNGRGERAASGVYLMRLEAGSTRAMRKMVLIK